LSITTHPRGRTTRTTSAAALPAALREACQIHVTHRERIMLRQGIRLKDRKHALRQRKIAAYGLHINLDLLALMGLLFGRTVRGQPRLLRSSLWGESCGASTLEFATQGLWCATTDLAR
jgi:hypothetical protein